MANKDNKLYTVIDWDKIAMLKTKEPSLEKFIEKYVMVDFIKVTFVNKNGKQVTFTITETMAERLIDELYPNGKELEMKGYQELISLLTSKGE